MVRTGFTKVRFDGLFFVTVAKSRLKSVAKVLTHGLGRYKLFVFRVHAAATAIGSIPISLRTGITASLVPMIALSKLIS
jgi:hypothetical protein